jgi:hypothetical protein
MQITLNLAQSSFPISSQSSFPISSATSRKIGVHACVCVCVSLFLSECVFIFLSSLPQSLSHTHSLSLGSPSPCVGGGKFQSCYGSCSVLGMFICKTMLDLASHSFILFNTLVHKNSRLLAQPSLSISAESILHVLECGGSCLKAFETPSTAIFGPSLALSHVFFKPSTRPSAAARGISRKV